ncbi:A-kinase-interacting protein 1 isoform X3 [Anarrhichthys ocellatus]|uniref:A-kinase-interacting protein 1 isoform X3 n=1 Tax=Anarrhichthys ocellatus TaxID=433405 RepID=UPI0012EED041|nr:A-kinase-interacting protein 1 isoform X3 [Anarrhichthys ocellatus]
MASQAWLESSLRRSASLGLEVLERASRRSVDWTSTGASQTPTTTDEDTQIPVKGSWHSRPISARGFMSRAVAPSPLTPRGAMCPGSTHGQLLGRRRLHRRPENMQLCHNTKVVCRRLVRISSSRSHRGRTPSLPACRSYSSRLSWSASELERASTSPLISDP